MKKYLINGSKYQNKEAFDMYKLYDKELTQKGFNTSNMLCKIDNTYIIGSLDFVTSYMVAKNYNNLYIENNQVIEENEYGQKMIYIKVNNEEIENLENKYGRIFSEEELREG